MVFLLLIFIFIIHETNLSKLNKQSKLVKRKLELSNDIVILHVNDVHCGINDTIGYDGYALYRDYLKTKYKDVITVDVGDHIQGGTLGSVSEGEAIIDIMNKVGFDVATVGNHEFDYGIQQLNTLGDQITNKYISSNFCYKKNKTLIFAPYKIVEAGNKKVAFIGVVTPLTFSKTYLSTIKDEDGEQVYDFLSGNNGQELNDKIQEYINEIRKDKKADYIILLTHIGMGAEQYKSEEILSNLEGVDAVLDGHTHKVYNTTTEDKSNKKIPISQTGTKLQNIGTLIIKEDGNITSEMLDEVPEPDDKANATQLNRGGKDRWVEKELNEYINSKWSDYEEILNEKVGYSSTDFILSDDAHASICRVQECQLGNLVADAMKDAGNAEISILNGGSIRSKLNSGNITKKEVIDVLPWFNNIVQKQVTGQSIVDALEFGVSKLPQPSGGFPQVSGITYDIDQGINSSVVTDSSGMFLNVTGKRRISNVKINGKDIELDKKYNASLIEFIANGGDGYSMFSPFEIYNESLITDTDALALYIEDDLKGEIPESYKDLQGRINIFNNTDDGMTSIITTEITTTTQITTTPTTPVTEKIDDSTINNTFPRNNGKTGGISTGGIIAIIIPTIVALLAALGIAMACKGKSSTPPIDYTYNTNYSNQNIIIKN